MIKSAIVINKDNYITPSQVDDGFALIIVIDGIPQFHVSQKGERLIYEDIGMAITLLSQYEKVKWNGSEWIGVGEPIPQPELQPTPPNPIEELLFRITMLEVELGHMEHADELLESGRLSPERQLELENVLERSGVSSKTKP